MHTNENQLFSVEPIPKDGSCLFHCFRVAFNIESVENVRSICYRTLCEWKQEAIEKNDHMCIRMLQDVVPDTDDYLQKMSNLDYWGGAFEISLLSKHFQSHVIVFKINNINNNNTTITTLHYPDSINNNYTKVVYLVYINNNHYDIISLTNQTTQHKRFVHPFNQHNEVTQQSIVQILQTHYYNNNNEKKTYNQNEHKSISAKAFFITCPNNDNDKYDILKLILDYHCYKELADGKDYSKLPKTLTCVSGQAFVFSEFLLSINQLIVGERLNITRSYPKLFENTTNELSSLENFNSIVHIKKIEEIRKSFELQYQEYSRVGSNVKKHFLWLMSQKFPSSVLLVDNSEEYKNELQKFDLVVEGFFKQATDLLININELLRSIAQWIIKLTIDNSNEKKQVLTKQFEDMKNNLNLMILRFVQIEGINVDTQIQQYFKSFVNMLTESFNEEIQYIEQEHKYDNNTYSKVTVEDGYDSDQDEDNINTTTNNDPRFNFSVFGRAEQSNKINNNSSNGLFSTVTNVITRPWQILNSGFQALTNLTKTSTTRNIDDNKIEQEYNEKSDTLDSNHSNQETPTFIDIPPNLTQQDLKCFSIISLMLTGETDMNLNELITALAYLFDETNDYYIFSHQQKLIFQHLNQKWNDIGTQATQKNLELIVMETFTKQKLHDSLNETMQKYQEALDFDNLPNVNRIIQSLENLNSW